MFVQFSWEHGINKLCTLTWNGNRWIPYYMIGSKIKHDWIQKQPPFGLGTRWGLHIYPCGISVSEPCEPLKYVTGRSFSFFFLTSLIISRIPSQIKESTIWYDSWKRGEESMGPKVKLLHNWKRWWSHRKIGEEK